MNSACELGRHSARALKPYPDYTDSGVEWLGNVPAHWHARRLKNVAGLIMGQSPSSEDCSTARIGLPFIQGCAEFGSDHPEPVQFCLAPAKVSPAGAILLSVRAPVGRLNVADQRYGIGRGLCAVVPRPSFLDATFCRYSLGSSTVGLTLQSTGSTYDAVSVGDVACLRTVVPLISEQAAIVRFLDHADRRIRRYIHAKQQLIALLEEQKQALIHRTVTGQIDVRTGRPYGVYKPAGVLGLPEVPKDWELCRLRNVVSVVTTGSRGWSSYASDTGPLFVRVANLSRGSLKLRFDDEVRLDLPSTSEAGRTRIKPGDLLVSVTAYIGSVGIAPEEFEEAYVSQHVARCQPLPEVCSRWLGYVLLSSVGQTHGQVSLYGGTKDGLSLDDVKNYPILLPPRNEQEAAVQWIEGELSALVKIGDSTKRELEMVREYRTRLIADVVTGKLDVRAAAARLPDEVEELEPLDEADALIDGEEEPTDVLATVP